MSVIDVKREHDLGVPTARERAEQLAVKLQEKLDLVYRWEGDHLEFQRTGAKGRIEVTPAYVRVYIELAMLLRPIRGKVESKVDQYLDEYVGPARR